MPRLAARARWRPRRPPPPPRSVAIRSSRDVLRWLRADIRGTDVTGSGWRRRTPGLSPSRRRLVRASGAASRPVAPVFEPEVERPAWERAQAPPGSVRASAWTGPAVRVWASRPWPGGGGAGPPAEPAGRGRRRAVARRSRRRHRVREAPRARARLQPGAGRRSRAPRARRPAPASTSTPAGPRSYGRAGDGPRAAGNDARITACRRLAGADPEAHVLADASLPADPDRDAHAGG